MCYPHRAIPEIATFLSDKDAGSRLAALNALAEAYAQIGDRVLEYIGELPPKEQTLLEERLKRTESPSSPKPTKFTGRVTPKRSNSQQSLSRPESRAGSSKPQAVASRLPSSTSTGRRTSLLPGPLGASTRHKTQLPSSTEAYQKSAVSTSKTLSSQNWVTEEAMPRHGDASVSLEATEPFSSIRSRDIAESVDTLKRLQKSIASNPESLEAHASSLVDAVSGQMAFAFEGLNEDTPQNTLRLCKHLMQTLSAFFDQRSLSLAVPKATLATLLAELTKRLLETAASAASEAIVSLSKVLNMVLIRIFHNSDNSACFG